MFSKNGKPTIINKMHPDDFDLGGVRMTKEDIRQVRKLYGCPNTEISFEISQRNSAFRPPRTTTKTTTRPTTTTTPTTTTASPTTTTSTTTPSVDEISVNVTSEKSVKISWNFTEEADSYIVFIVGLDADGRNASATIPGSSSSVSVSFLKPDSNYRFVIKPVKDGVIGEGRSVDFKTGTEFII